MPLVSVIIPCYNAARFLRDTLASVFAQTDVELQVLVIDDGSTDDSAEIVTREFPQVELIRTENRGASHARNTGLDCARGEYIQFVDADDVLAPDKIARQLAVLQDGGADVVYGDWAYLLRRADGTETIVPAAGEPMRGAPELALFVDFWAPLCAYLFRREIVRAVGTFNPALPILQDARFVLDCALRGGRFAYLPGAACYYRVHAAQLSRARVAFVRDCLSNARQVQAWWETHGGVSPERRAALVAVYGNVARMSFEIDRATFWDAYRALQQWTPRYIPAQPRGLALCARLVGYPRAEHLAWWYRRAKKAVGLYQPGTQHPTLDGARGL